MVILLGVSWFNYPSYIHHSIRQPTCPYIAHGILNTKNYAKEGYMEPRQFENRFSMTWSFNL